MKLGDVVQDSDGNQGFFYYIGFRGPYADSYIIFTQNKSYNHLHREISEPMYRGLLRMVMI